MLLGLIYTELIKYRRTAVIWMVLIGGFLAALTGYLLVSNGEAEASWNNYAATSLNCVNLLALLLVAVITGYVIIGEYTGGTSSTIFTYPVSRLKLFLIKFLIILVFILGLYLVFFLTAILFGTVYLGGLPSTDLLLKFASICLLMAVMNFIMAPVTAIISLLVKGTATYLFAGMGYFIIYISLLTSDYSYLILPCTPNKLIDNYYNSVFLTSSNITTIAALSAATFIVAFISASLYYLKSDCR